MTQTNLANQPSSNLPSVGFIISQSGRAADGGVESISQLLGKLTRYRPFVVTHLETRYTQLWKKHGIEVHLCDMIFPHSFSSWPSYLAMNYRRTRTVIGANRFLMKLIREKKCQTIHCNDLNAFFHCFLATQLTSSKLIFSIRDIQAYFGPQWRLARTLSDKTVVLSDEMGESVKKKIPTFSWTPSAVQTDLRRIYSIVDFDKAQPCKNVSRAEIRESLGIPQDVFAIAYSANFIPRKAQLDFIKKTVPLLRQHSEKIKVYFLGDLSPKENLYAKQCLNAVRDLHLEDCVKFPGFQSNPYPWYRAADLTCIASKNEGLARCMIESLSCGTPVMSFDVCSAKEILEGHACGRVIEQGMHEDFAQALIELESNRSRLHQLGENGIKTAHQLFSPQKSVEEYELLLDKLANPLPS